MEKTQISQSDTGIRKDDVKILLIDTDSEHLQSAEKILFDSGYRCARTDSVQNAMFLLSNLPSIDLIISDIVLADGNALKLLKSISSNPRLNHIPVLICASLTDQETVLQYIKGGARDFIAKPVNSEVLSNKINRIVRNTQSSVLIVDDDRLIRELLSATIEREGYKAVAAADGKEAIAIMEAGGIKAIISDIEMPNMDGFELVEKVKSLYPEVPVILITGHAQKFSKDEILKSGADGYIGKPFKNVEIISSLFKFNVRPS